MTRTKKALKKLEKFPIKTGTDNRKAAEADIIFLAVHPPIIKSVLQEGLKKRFHNSITRS